MTRQVARKTAAPKKVSKIGYAPDAVTYGDAVKASKFKIRALAFFGDLLDLMRGDAPLFPKDAPLGQPNCGVVAMCMLLDKPYAPVVEILAREHRQGWIGGTYRHQYAPCAQELGFEVEVFTFKGTVADLAEHSKGSKERIFCAIHGHAMVIQNGLIFDQSYVAGGTAKERPEVAFERIEFTMRRL